MVCSSLSHPENGEEKECIISLWWGIKDKVICSITVGFWSSLSTSFARENAPSLSSFFVFIHLFRLFHLSPDPQRLCLKFLPPYSPLISWFYSRIYSPTFPLLLNHFPNSELTCSLLSPYSSSGLSPFSLLKATFLSLITSPILV